MKIAVYICCFIIIFLPSARSQNAPVTTAGRVIDATPGNQSVPVPITVESFNNIGQFTLTMNFDTTKVRYVSSTTNPSLPGMTITYTAPLSNTQGKIVFAWTGTENTSLADGTSIADLTFHYVTGTGILSWAFILGSICRYRTYISGNLTTMNDDPKYLYYLDGGISNRTAPVTTAPIIPDPVPGSLSLPVTVNGFTTIGGFTLNLEYDTTIITYQNSFIKNPAFGSAFQVGNNPGTGSKKLITIAWFGGSVTLADGSVLVTLDFSYPVASCDPCLLRWHDNGPSCEFTDSQSNLLIDMPQPLYYIDGIVATGLQNTWTGNINSDWNTAGNWNDCGVPDTERDIIIPDVLPNAFPILNSAGSCKSIWVETGAFLTIGAGGILMIGNN